MVETKIITDVVKDWLTSFEVKDHLKISSSDDNNVIRDLINGSRKLIEKYCSISLGTQTLKTVMDLEEYEEAEIPFGPVQSITTVKYKIPYGDYVTADLNDEYELDGLDFKTIKPLLGGRWEITYVAGYNPIPQDLKMFWLRLVAYYYENRGEQSNIPSEIKSDLINYRRLYVL